MLTTEDSCSLTMSGGTVGQDIIAAGDSGILITGGTIVGGVFVGDQASLRMDGGSASVAYARFSGTVVINGGSLVGDLNAQEQGITKLFAGTVGGNVRTHNNAQSFVSGGSVVGSLLAYDDSIISMTGGSVAGDAEAHDHSHILYSGGTIAGGITPMALSAMRASTALAPLAQGDPFSLNITAFDQASIDFIGTDFSVALLDPNYQGMFSEYELSGILADGTTINDGTFLVTNGTGAIYELNGVPVPEPGTAAMLVFAVVGWGCQGCRRRSARVVPRKRQC